MRLAKRCRNCGEYFEAEPLSLEVYCDKGRCQAKREYFINRVKKSRGVRMRVFDIYDLERPITNSVTGKVIAHERVCRYCGAPLKKKDGSYSKGRCYCNNPDHDGYELFSKHNWSTCSKAYVAKVREIQEEALLNAYEERGLDLYYGVRQLLFCEKCGKLCKTYGDLRDVKHGKKVALQMINVHHEVPVHSLAPDEITLIWDFDNLICLCKECHNKAHASPGIISRAHAEQFKKMEDYI